MIQNVLVLHGLAEVIGEEGMHVTMWRVVIFLSVPKPPTPPPPKALGAMPPPSALAGIPTLPQPMPTSIPTGLGLPPVTAVASTVAGTTPTAAMASATALVANLLPLSGLGGPPGANGVYIGEGLPPVPAKLAERIRRW